MIAQDKRIRNRAQMRLRAAREPHPINLNQRLSFSPKEFSEANGRSGTWGYRQIYSGKVKVISDCGRMLIPRSEVDRFLSRAGEYNPQGKPSKAEKMEGQREITAKKSARRAGEQDRA